MKVGDKMNKIITKIMIITSMIVSAFIFLPVACRAATYIEYPVGTNENTFISGPVNFKDLDGYTTGGWYQAYVSGGNGLFARKNTFTIRTDEFDLDGITSINWTDTAKQAQQIPAHNIVLEESKKIYFVSTGGSQDFSDNTWTNTANATGKVYLEYTVSGYDTSGDQRTLTYGNDYAGQYQFSGTIDKVLLYGTKPPVLSFNANGGSGAPNDIVQVETTSTAALQDSIANQTYISAYGSVRTTRSNSLDLSTADSATFTFRAFVSGNVTNYTVPYFWVNLIDAKSGETLYESGTQTFTPGTGSNLATKEYIVPIKAIRLDNDVSDVYFSVSMQNYRIGNYSIDGVIYSDVDTNIKIKSNSITIPNQIPTKSGCDFVKWNTSQDGTGTAFAPGDTLTITENATLYAQWKLKTPYFSGFSGNGNLPSAITNIINSNNYC